jgi:hypothetical protein
VYLPSYSRFLNPIEVFLFEMKAEVRRNPLSANDILSDRI